MQLAVRILTEDEYPLWDRLVADSPQHSIFAERWWIDIVTRGEGKLLGCFADTRLLGGTPIWPQTKYGIRRLRQPPLTPYWGPLLAPFEGSYQTRLNTEFVVLRAIADALTTWQDVIMQFHPSLSNWLAFYWDGFTQTTRYTYRIEQWPEQMTPEEFCIYSVRHKIKHATKCGLTIVNDADPMVAVQMSRVSMEHQGVKGSEEIYHFWPALSQAALQRNRLYITAALDHRGVVCEASAMVWDKQCAYGLLGGGESRVRAFGGGVLVQWHVLQKAATLAPAFDFEGSMIEGVERFMRSFGGTLTPYSLVTRANSVPLNTARALQRGWQRMHTARRSESHPSAAEEA